MTRGLSKIIFKQKRGLSLAMAILALSTLVATLSRPVSAQDQDQDDPPSRVARLAYIEGSVSFQPSGESEWVEAVPNRPMTTGDKVWADRDSRAEVQLGGASIDLSANTGFSFLNLDDHTVQIQLSSGVLNARVRELDNGDIFEIDTPNQAFTIDRPGRYRVEAAEDGSYTVVTISDGAGESTGNGQSYTLHAGQRTTFSGTDSLNAEVEQIGNPDDFDTWSDARYRRYDDSRSAHYMSTDVVGYEDLDDNGDWRPSQQYGDVWYPRVSAGWAPYHDGHWAWVDPWGWTWVDDARWGYAPFHYGRWISVEGRWGWIPGPREVHPVYAPALVAFVGGGGIGIGGNVAWFPLGPREVYVPSYRVGPSYVNRVNVSNTTVNTTTITNVYNTTIINKSTTINNVTYVNRNVQGAVTAVPQRAFTTAQPVARAAVAVNTREMAAAPVSSRAAVPPAREAVFGAHAATANRVAAPPQAVANRAVIAKAAPPPPSASFAAKQQVLTQHPGESVPRQQMQQLRPANATSAALVKRAPPAKPATATPSPTRPPNQPAGNQPAANQPGNRPGNQPAANQPANRPGNQPANERPGANPATPPQPTNRPEANRPNQPTPPQPVPNQPAPNNRPENNRPEPNRPQPNQPTPNQPVPNNRPDNNPPEANRPEPNRPTPNQPAPTDRPPTARPDNRPEPTRPQPNQPVPNNRPDNNRPEPNRPTPSQPVPNNRPDNARPENNRPENNRPEANRPEANRPENTRPPEQARPQTPPPNQRPQERAAPPEGKPAPQPKPLTPEEKKRQDEQRKQDQKPQ